MQKNYLNKIQEVNPKDGFYYCNLYTRGGKLTHGAWQYTNGHIPEHIDERAIFENEVVFDLDVKPWTACRHQTLKIQSILKSESIPFYTCLTGGKGTHTHIFLKFPKDQEVRKLVSEAEKYGLTGKDIRLWFWNQILDKAGMPADKRGHGKHYDSAVVGFNDNESKGHLIRSIGGRKATYNEADETEKITYKTFIPFDSEIPKKRTTINEKEKVEYPESIIPYTINTTEIQAFLINWLKQVKEKQEPVAFDYAGEYLNLFCIKTLLKGVGEGKRNLAAKAITAAALLSGKSAQETELILEDFAKRSEQIPTRFSEREAKSWIPWFKARDSPQWFCTDCQKIDACKRDGCVLLDQKNKDVIEFLKTPRILDKILEIIQNKGGGKTWSDVVGEENNLKMLFLIMLSTYSNNPQNVKLTGESSTGKTAMVMPVTKLFPSDNLILAKGISSKALYYEAKMQEDGKFVYDFNNKIIVMLEEGESESFLSEIKPILSHDVEEMVYKATQGTGKDGSRETKSIYLRNWPAYIGLSVESFRGEEQATREWAIAPESSLAKFSNVILNNAKSNPVWKDWKHPQRKLLMKAIKEGWRQIEVINLYKEQIAKAFPMDQPRTMRDWNKLSTMIDLVTFVNQHQRDVKEIRGSKYVFTTKEDVLEAFEIIKESLIITLSGVSNEPRQFYKWLCEEMVQKRAKSGLESYSENVGMDLGMTKNQGVELVYKHTNRRISSDLFSKIYYAPLKNSGWIATEMSGRNTVFIPTAGSHSNVILNFEQRLNELYLSKEEVEGFLFFLENGEKPWNGVGIKRNTDFGYCVKKESSIQDSTIPEIKRHLLDCIPTLDSVLINRLVEKNGVMKIEEIEAEKLGENLSRLRRQGVVFESPAGTIRLVEGGKKNDEYKRN